jgi:anti-sigma factor RsiW
MYLALDEEATPDERSELREHLAACDACAAEWRALQAVEGLLTRAQPVAPPATLAPSVMLGVERRRRSQARWQRLRSFLYVLVGCLALATAPVLLIVSALEHNPLAAQVLTGLWADIAAIMRALMGVCQTFTRALTGGPLGVLALAWVLLAALFAVAWLRLVAKARPTGIGPRAV